MSGATRVILTPEYLRPVRDILVAYLPPRVKVWLFGSRASGRVRRYFDLDPAIDSGRPPSCSETATLHERRVKL
jgi:predicted nucleotidyltransferase